MTGTIKFPEGKAAAMPILIFLRLMMFWPSKDTLMFGKSLMALTTASINIGVKVIFSFSFFSNPPLILSLHWTKLVTSTSTNEVTCGLVDLLITMWSAISLRILSISTISSPGIKAILDLCTFTSVVTGVEEAGTGVDTDLGAEDWFLPFAMYLRISALVTLLSLPVPGIASNSDILIPSVLAILSTKGE